MGNCACASDRYDNLLGMIETRADLPVETNIDEI